LEYWSDGLSFVNSMHQRIPMAISSRNRRIIFTKYPEPLPPGQLVKCFDQLHRDFGIFCKHETQALPNYSQMTLASFYKPMENRFFNKISYCGNSTR